MGKLLQLQKLIDLDELQAIQNSFAGTVGTSSVIFSPEGVPLTRFSNPTGFCSLIQSTDEGKKRCFQSFMEMTRKALEVKEPKILYCFAHGGHFVAPIIIDGAHKGTMFSGQFIPQEFSPEQLKAIERLAEEINLDPGLLLEKARNMRVVKEDVVWNYSALLFQIVGVLAKLGAQKAGLSRAKDEVQTARNELEIRVQERTAELKQEITERKQAEKTVRKERDAAQRYLNISGVMFVVINSDRKVRLINKKGCEILEYREEDIIGKDWFSNFLPERVRDNTIRVFESLMAGDVEPVEYHENRVLTKSGNERVISWHNCILRDEEGRIQGTLGSGEDITERKQAEESLRKSESRFKSIAESMSDCIWEVDRDEVYIYCSNNVKDVLGYTCEEIIGKTPFDLMPSDERERVGTFFAEILKKNRPFRNLENWNLTKDGQLVCFLSSGTPMFDEKGAFAGYRGVDSDITARKQAEEEQKKTNQELEKAVELANQMAARAEAANIAKSEFLANMSHEIRTPMNAVIGFTDMLLDTNLEKNQIDYARTIRSSGNALLSVINDVLDFSKIEAGELYFEEIDFDPELLAYDICELTRPRIGSKPVEILCRIGDNLPSQVRGEPGRFRQVLINLMGNASKFTESGEIELSLDIEEEKDNQVKFHAAIRDTGIGIPKDKLSAIFSPFQQADGSTTRKYGGTGLGLSICKKISEIMRGDVWAKSPGPGSVFHFTAWLEKAEDKEAGRFTPVSLSNKKALIIDDNQTNLNILTHLLESACMRVVALRNGADVVPTLRNAFDSGDPFDSCIIDIQMPGMSGYDVVKQIRDPKSSIINHQSSIQSLPLLALSSLMERNARKCEEAGFDGFLSKPIRREKLYRMLERMIGGRKVEGKKNEVVKEKIITQYSVREEMKRSVRILLAEDNPVNQKLAKMMLTKAGYQVEVADNGKEAVEKYTASPENFDLIFMDIQMPEMDGIAATREIRKQATIINQQSSIKRIPIVAMTAHAMKGDREICIEAGMDDYITKPIKRELVFEVLEKWVF